MIIALCIFTPMLFLMALDLASTSSKADALLDTFNHAGIKHGPNSYQHIAWLGSSLRQLNRDQGKKLSPTCLPAPRALTDDRACSAGLGLKLLGSVVDKKSIRNAGIAVCGGATTLVTTMLALSEDSQPSAATTACSLSAAEAAALRGVARTFANSSCSYAKSRLAAFSGGRSGSNKMLCV